MPPEVLCERCLQELAETPLGEAVRALVEAPPGSLAVLWVHPARWDPGEQSLLRQRVRAFLRTLGWELLRELPCDAASLGSLHVFHPHPHPHPRAEPHPGTHPRADTERSSHRARSRTE